MPSPDLAVEIANLPGFALFVFFILAAGVGLWRRWWVPGWLYDDERAARRLAENQALRNAEALEKQGEALEKLARAASRERRRPVRPVDDDARAG